MLSLRVSRDKRGYDLIYLVWDQRRRGRPEPRLLYCCRLPAPLRVGPPPFDDDVRRMLEDAHPEIAFDWPGLLKSLLGAVNTPRPAAPAPPFRPRRTGQSTTTATSSSPSSPYANGHRPPPRGMPLSAFPAASSRPNATASWTSPSPAITVPEPPETSVAWIEVQQTIIEVRHAAPSPIESTWRSPSSLLEDTVIEGVKEEDSDEALDAEPVSPGAQASASEPGLVADQRRRRRRRRGGRGREGAMGGRGVGEGTSTGGPSSGGSDSD